MTNQEAIETLKANYPYAWYEQLREAVNLAIYALQRTAPVQRKRQGDHSHPFADDVMMKGDGDKGLISRQSTIDLRKQAAIIDELSKMPTMVIATAYLHAINYTLYGEDVTEKWLTATQNASALDKAYRKGYHDAMEKFTRK